MLNPKNILPGNEQYEEFTPVTVPKYKRKKQVYYYYRSKIAKQADSIVAYFLVDINDTNLRKASFRIAGTGHPIEDHHAQNFVGTIAMADRLIFHVFLLNN